MWSWGDGEDLPARHLGELLAIALLDNIGDVVIHACGRERVADSKEGVHPIGRLIDLHKHVKCRSVIAGEEKIPGHTGSS